MMKIAVYGKKFGPEASASVQTLFDELCKSGVPIMINNDFVQFIADKTVVKCDYKVYTVFEEIYDADVLLSIGGDGTILDTITTIRDSNIPIIGFNTGRLGFLANNPKDEAAELIAKLIDRDFDLEERTLLSLDVEDNLFGENNFALNELTIHKKDSSSMMTIHTYINDDYLNSYWADGLIIATPTGSTAYSLSCGGPIIIPNSKNLVINPISPHNLSARPVVVSDDVKIKLKVEGRDEAFLATLDSRSVSIPNNTELIISKASFTVKLIRFKDQNFLSTIRNKLLWGVDKRN